MRRFQFSLQTVLRHREVLEGEREQEFAVAQQAVIALEMRIAQLNIERDLCLKSRPCGGIGGRFDVSGMADRERFVNALESRIESAERERDAAHIVAEEARAALVKAKQDREAVAKLREQAHNAYLSETQKQEQELLDEMATSRHKIGRKVA